MSWTWTPPKDAPNCVIWSGGADSTLILCDVLKQSRRNEKVTAISVVAHDNLASLQLEKQNEAMDRFLVLAKKRHWEIEHIKLSVGIPINAQLPATQTVAWLCAVAPHLPVRARVLFGYVRGDDFWHSKTEFLKAAKALGSLSERSWGFDFPLEWERKPDILARLRDHRIPNKVWWTCESPVKKRGRVVACKKCLKCKEIDVEIPKKGVLTEVSKVVMKAT